MPLRTTLEEMGHPQPPTPVRTDNSTAEQIVNDPCKQQRSRAIDMRYHWLRDRIKQGQFKVHWAPAADNLADYHSKHHLPAHHRKCRPIYLHMKQSPPTIPSSTHKQDLQAILRGCANHLQPLQQSDHQGLNQS